MDTHWTIVILSVISLYCGHLAESTPDPTLCSDTPNLPEQLPLKQFPQDFTTTIEINHVKNTKIPELVDYTVMMKAVRGKNRGAIQVQETGMKETFIYDFGRKQMINIEQNENAYSCRAQKLGEGADWIIGPGSTGDHVPAFGTPEWLFRYGPYDREELYLGQTYVRGIPVNHWRVCSDSEETGTVVVHHYWSDPFQWTPLIGKNMTDPQNLPYVVPVAIEVEVKKQQEEYKQMFSFFTYDIAPALQSEFDVPDGMYCDNLSSEDVKVPKLSDYFSFDSEILIRATPGDIVTNQKHLYDKKLNLTRLDFSMALDNFGGATNVEKLTYIEDFERLISFLINKRDGSCVIQKITENSGNVVIHNGKLTLADPFTAMRNGGDVKMLTYYRQSTDRGITAEVFKGLVNRGNNSAVQELWYTSIFETIEESTIENQVPMKIIEYSRKDSFSNRVEWNIFNFDKSEPDIFLYDVTSCFHHDGRQHFKFNLNRAYDDLNPNGETQLRYTILTKLIQWSMLHPLRISNVQLDGVPNETVVIFTILGKPKVTEGIDELDTEFVVEVLEMIFDLNMANVPYKDEKGNEVILQVVPNSFEEIDREGHCWKPSPPTETTDTITEATEPSTETNTSTEPPTETNTSSEPPTETNISTEPPTETNTSTEPPAETNTSTEDPSTLSQDQNNPTAGYSGGSMAALGICMTLLGLSLGVGGMILYKRKLGLSACGKVFKYPADFEHKMFKNEKHGDRSYS